MTAIYTACFGGYDGLPRHPDIPGVEFIAYTDYPYDSPYWDVKVVKAPAVHPRMQAKFYKVFPHLCLPDHGHTIWIDASHEILTPEFAVNALSSIGESGMALYEHPWRDCIYDEADASVKLEKYKGQPIKEQSWAYRQEGHPEHWGLFACGTLARVNSAPIRQLMNEWWHEMDLWSYQDQISLPVVCRRLEMRPETFPVHQVYGNQWTAIHPHNRDD